MLLIYEGILTVPQLGNYYFECLSNLLREVFCQEFLDSQDVLVAAGAPSIQIDNLLEWKDSAFICIFQDIQPSGKGYFCPQSQYLILEFAQAHRRIPEKIEELKNKFNFTGLGANEIHSTLRAYCRFVTKAKNHKSHDRNEEAFLHYVIALDLLFGDKKSSTQNVARRTAIIVSNAVGKQFREKFLILQGLYDRRSKYVHEGKSISKNDIDIIEPIIDEVLLCLLRLQAIPKNNQPGFIESWLKELDYLAAAVEAGKIPDDQEFMANGIESSPGLGCRV